MKLFSKIDDDVKLLTVCLMKVVSSVPLLLLLIEEGEKLRGFLSIFGEADNIGEVTI